MRFIAYKCASLLLAIALMSLAVLVLMESPCVAADLTTDELKSQVTAASRDFRDLSLTAVVTEKNKDAMANVEPNYAQLYEFKSAKLALKCPDKMRIEGKLGMVKFEYVINGTLKTFRSPTVRINKKDDYSHAPGKVQDALDIGIVTPSLWKYRRIEVVDDPEAEAKNQVRVNMHYDNSESRYSIWLDAKDLYLREYEKRDGDGNLRVHVVYSNHERVDDVIWVPKKIEVYSPNGQKAGTSEFGEIAVNSSLPDTLFQ